MATDENVLGPVTKPENINFRLSMPAIHLIEGETLITRRWNGMRASDGLVTAEGLLLVVDRLSAQEVLTPAERTVLQERAEVVRAALERMYLEQINGTVTRP